ncbi:unnamed protein product [Rodentolepis nana]|uniref:Uncharacterized protein n=1 Tax=Rodentolepis nana TaxID=102285 RepID=A0A0R3TMF0_RODNA|nr:unnamed protein product [Rodentolepis nana]
MPLTLASGLTVLPSQPLLQQQQQRPNFIRQLPATASIPTTLSPPATSLDSLPRELPIEAEVSNEQEERSSAAMTDEFLFNSDASAEAAAAVANLEAESSSGFEVDDVDMYLNHHNPSPQQQQKQQQTQSAHFSRSAAAGATTSANASVPNSKDVSEVGSSCLDHSHLLPQSLAARVGPLVLSFG